MSIGLPVKDSYTGNEWVTEANCIAHPEPDIFFTPALYIEAIKYCADCPVKAQCLAEGIRQDRAGRGGGKYGVWGGLTPEERVALKRRNRRAA